jgi:CheY-like chemotaxis protein
VSALPATEESLPGGQPVVLVVDDHPELCRMVRFAFEREGFRVFEAADGRAALELMHEVTPMVIVLDVDMPRMDGWGFRAAQRALPGLRDVPVVLFTGGGPAVPPSPELAPSAVVPKTAGVNRLLAAVRSVLGPA